MPRGGASRKTGQDLLLSSGTDLIHGDPPCSPVVVLQLLVRWVPSCVGRLAFQHRENPVRLCTQDDEVVLSNSVFCSGGHLLAVVDAVLVQDAPHLQLIHPAIDEIDRCLKTKTDFGTLCSEV